MVDINRKRQYRGRDCDEHMEGRSQEKDGECPLCGQRVPLARLEQHVQAELRASEASHERPEGRGRGRGRAQRSRGGGRGGRGNEAARQTSKQSGPCEKDISSTTSSDVLEESDMPEYIDTHCHIDYVLDKLRLPSWQEFQKRYRLPSNFGGCITVLCDPSAFSPSFATWPDLLDTFPNIYAAFGMHPHNAKYYNESTEQKIIECLQHPKAVAWGECGLDYAKNLSPQEVQRTAFAAQVAKAVELGKPLVVHSRNAEKDTFDILQSNMPSDWRVHIHCFTDSVEQAKRYLSTFPNAYIGFTGVLTFPDAEKLRKVVRVVPLDRILLETDGPYMLPRNRQQVRDKPERGGRGRGRGGRGGGVCHSGHIPWIARQIAKEKEVSLQQVYSTIRQNTTRMYGI